MRNFIRKITLFFPIYILSVFILGLFGEYIIHLNTKNNQFQLQEDWHIHHPIENELLFIGNSRTWVHIDAEKISKTINRKSYCLAQDGRESRVLFWKLKCYLSRNKKPKEVFIQFDPYFISNRNDGTFYGKKKYLAYIYKDRLKINNVFSNEIGYNNYEEYFPIIRYRGEIPLLFHHLTGIRSYNSNLFIFGSELQKRTWQKSSNFKYPEETNGELNFSYMDSIIKICKNLEIKTTLIYSPQSYSSYKAVDQNIFRQLKDYAKTNELTFLDFNSEVYNDSSLFYNHMHLNSKGATKFTLQLIDTITSSKSNHTHQGSN
jgi:hypothetical protein